MLIAEPGVTANLLFRVFILKCRWQWTALMWFYLSAGNCPPNTLPCTLQREQAWAWWHPATHKPLVLHVGYKSFLPCCLHMYQFFSAFSWIQLVYNLVLSCRLTSAHWVLSDLADAPHQLPWVGFICFLCDAFSWSIVLYLNHLDKN